MCVHVCVNRPSTGASIFEVCVCLCVSTVLVQVHLYVCACVCVNSPSTGASICVCSRTGASICVCMSTVLIVQVRPYACVCPQS